MRRLLVTASSLLTAGALAAQAPPRRPVPVRTPIVSTWKHLAALPSARSGAAVGWAEDLLVVAGGMASGEDGTPRPVDRVDAFDPAVLAWTPLPPLPRPLAYAAGAADERHLYVLGGQEGGSVSNRCWRLSREGTGWSWQSLPPLPRPRTRAAAHVTGGILYLAGGAETPDGYDRVSGDLLRLDLGRLEDGWTVAGTLPGPARCSLAMGGYGRYLYLFGGARAGKDGRPENLADAWRFDPKESAWRSLPQLPWPLRSATAVSLGPQGIALMGGYSADADEAARFGPGYGYERRVLTYALDRYRPGSPLPASLADARGALRRDRVYLVGGEMGAGSYADGLLTTSAATLVERAPARPVYLCLGGSIALGKDAVPEEEAFPKRLESALASAPNPPWVLNGGQEAEISIEALARLPSAARPLARVDAAILLYGLDDIAPSEGDVPGEGMKGEPRVPLDRYRENLRALVREVRRLGGTAVLCTPTPITPEYAQTFQDRYTAGTDPVFLLKVYADAVRKLGREEGLAVADLYEGFRQRKNWELLLADGAHPNAEGHQLIADLVKRALRPGPIGGARRAGMGS